MKYVYTALLTPRVSGGYECRVPDIPHCVTSGTDLEDALFMIADAATMMLTVYEDENLPIPPASAPGTIQCSAGVISTLLLLDTTSFRLKYNNEATQKTA